MNKLAVFFWGCSVWICHGFLAIRVCEVLIVVYVAEFFVPSFRFLRAGCF